MSAGDWTIKLWNAETGELIKLPKIAVAGYALSSLSFSPDSKRIASGCSVFDVKSGAKLLNLKSRGIYRLVFSPDGSKLALVHLDRGNYRIAVLDLDSRDLLVLSGGRQDESPSFAPNSDSLIYATRQGRNGVLETVSADGLVRQRLASGQGDVREPVWSPYPRY